MRHRKLSARDIAAALEALRNGASVRNVCDTWHIGPSTLYYLKENFDGLAETVIEQIDHLMTENAQLREREQKLAQDYAALKLALQWLDLNPGQRRILVDVLQRHHTLSLARACRLVGISRTVYAYESKHASNEVELTSPNRTDFGGGPNS
ncbi:hypothetical protein [Burkholderia ubonensis]|uniref:hypothetical protein n=1 Tax=Burkholderia ubonensis TaxID=101571 RepID=UPI0012F861EC|nr:hypothetical protein [Burkholderia ubonensis]